ncbi:unnamed protein product [Darwinula stevensoni]|uniref:Uncharacterized protein n=1 Tax=Darwinula stevensoni TaxID=69355 RepID=A0A7R8X7G6_9CRUS|nr:unnamed protein product [Darwinula stevensoni]CAG0889101.1 unnamed protein product [Darwinula stevensoni]
MGNAAKTKPAERSRPIRTFHRISPSEIEISGLNVVLDRGSNLARRVIWAFILVVCFGLMLAQCLDRLFTFLSGPIAVTIQVTRNESLNFPAVTICSSIDEAVDRFDGNRVEDLWNREFGASKYPGIWKATRILSEKLGGAEFWELATYNISSIIASFDVGNLDHLRAYFPDGVKKHQRKQNFTFDYNFGFGILGVLLTRTHLTSRVNDLMFLIEVHERQEKAIDREDGERGKTEEAWSATVHMQQDLPIVSAFMQGEGVRKNQDKYIGVSIRNFTGKIKALIGDKKRKWDAYKRTGDSTDHEEYRRITRKSKREIRSARREREERLASDAKKNPKAFYRYASGRCRQSIGPLMNEKRESIASDKDTASILNEFFASVFTVESDSAPTLEEVTSARIEDISITEETIVNMIGKLKFEIVSRGDHPCVKDPTYSRSACQLACYEKDLLNRTNCSLPFMNTSAKACKGGEEFMRASNLSIRMLDGRDRNIPTWNPDKCGCHMPCKQSLYEFSPDSRSRQDNHSVTRVFYLDMTYEEIKEEPSYDIISLLCDLGGTLGLLLGASDPGMEHQHGNRLGPELSIGTPDHTSESLAA